jgi:2-polyprenyl-3-methyl-5-hydroxy-6-metoxy-1,4-benzoquinol methylase
VPTRCHVCNSPGFDAVLSADAGNLELNRCSACGFVYLSSWQESLANAEQLYDYYSDLTDEDLTERHSTQNRARQQALLQRLSSYTAGRKLLDVGCGDGQLLQTAGEAGWEAVGIDLSDAAVALCRRRGLDASNTDFFDRSLDARRFDVIVMSELIEHVPAPQRFLSRAESLLEPGGVLYLTTPNFGSLARRMLAERWSVMHPEHIGYFEPSTLRDMVRKETGLVALEVEANNIAPSTFVAWARGLRGQGAGSARAATETHRQAREGLDQGLRRVLHRSRLLRSSKDALNRAISGAGLGDTLVAWLQKPPRA